MKTIQYGLDGYSIIQIPNQSHCQMMSYLITTPENRLFVIDGGTKEDAGYLAQKIRSYGNVVDAWFVTHAHFDHIEALAEILNQPGNIKVKQIYYDFPPRDWLAKVENMYINSVDRLLNAMNDYQDIYGKPQRGMKLAFGNLKVEVLTDAQNYLDYTDYNSTSVVYRFIFPHASALFLGDLSEKSGSALVKQYGSALQSDIVQMAHHGQNGVSKDVYEQIAPKICLWPTPKWLWENDGGQGYNSGPWATLTTRKWMEDLGVKMHTAMFEGEWEIR